MAARKKVLVYGRSLNLAGLAACLKLDAKLDVRLVDPYQHGAREALDAFDPETIIYDLTDPPAELDLALLGERPNTLLIGVDPSSDHVLVLTGKRSRAVTMGELAALVAEKGERAPTPKKKLLVDQGGVNGRKH